MLHPVMAKNAVDITSKIELEHGIIEDVDGRSSQDGDASQLAQIGKKAVLKVLFSLQRSCMTSP